MEKKIEKKKERVCLDLDFACFDAEMSDKVSPVVNMASMEVEFVKVERESGSIDSFGWPFPVVENKEIGSIVKTEIKKECGADEVCTPGRKSGTMKT